jgi:hypothetical protein
MGTGKRVSAISLTTSSPNRFSDDIGKEYNVDISDFDNVIEAFVAKKPSPGIHKGDFIVITDKIETGSDLHVLWDIQNLRSIDKVDRKQRYVFYHPGKTFEERKALLMRYGLPEYLFDKAMIKPVLQKFVESIDKRL